MKFPKCEDKERQYKNGKTKAGSQMYRCGNCGTVIRLRKKPKGIAKSFILKAWQIGQKNTLNNN
jgi:transposase-like protein